MQGGYKDIPVLRREIFGWAMFDFANSSYTTLIVTVAFSVYYTKLVAPGREADFLWGLGSLLSNLLAMLSGPLVGAMADDMGRKKVFLFLTYALCVGGTFGLYFVLPGQAGLGLALFVISNAGFSMGENLCAAFLPEISTPANIGRVSGFGWGLGYLGGLACLLAAYPLLAGGFSVQNLENLRLTWVLTGAFFLVTAVPTFVFVHERAPRGPTREFTDYVRVTFSRIVATARSVRHFGDLARFLVVFLIFISGLATMISFSSIYASRTIGFSAKELILLFILLQISSAAGAFLFGLVQDQWGAKLTIRVMLVFWIAVCLGAYYVHTKGPFWVIAVGAGLGIGSVQSASRSLVGLFSPLEKSGEFFGLWGLAGKGAFMLGPFLFGIVSSSTGSQRVAILFTAGFFVAGLIGMNFVDEARGRAAALSWSRRHGGGQAQGCRS